MDNILSDNDIFLDQLNPMSIQKQIAERMKQRRLLINLGQQSLSKKSGVSFGSLKRFENKYQISLINLLQLAMALDALEEFNDLFPEQENKSIEEILNARKVNKRKRGKNA